MTRSTMSGRPALSCVACQSRVIVPALPTWVEVPDRWGVVGSCAELGAASSQSEQASEAPKAARVLMWTPPRPLESIRRGERFPAEGSEPRERTFARSGAGCDAAGDEAGVARDLAEIVQDGQEGARGGGTALALHQPFFVSPRVLVGHVLEAQALDLHVSRQHAVARQSEITRALEHLHRPLEEQIYLARAPWGEHRALRGHLLAATDEAFDGITDALHVRGYQAQRRGLRRLQHETLR